MWRPLTSNSTRKPKPSFIRPISTIPADPFTLNNLGYISELQGELDRAQKFYALASEQGGEALIDVSNSRQLEGKPMSYALTSLKDVPMRVNRMNVEAIELLSQRRNFEADDLLHQALALEPMNAFTLNNLGVAEEATGDFENALKYYDAAAAFHSSEPIVVTLKRSWRGKPVSEMAAESARELRKKMRTVGNDEAQATHAVASAEWQRPIATTGRPQSRIFSRLTRSIRRARSRSIILAMSRRRMATWRRRSSITPRPARQTMQTPALAWRRIGSAEGQQLLAVATDSGQQRRRRAGSVQPGATPANRPDRADSP